MRFICEASGETCVQRSLYVMQSPFILYLSRLASGISLYIHCQLAVYIMFSRDDKSDELLQIVIEVLNVVRLSIRLFVYLSLRTRSHCLVNICLNADFSAGTTCLSVCLGLSVCPSVCLSVSVSVSPSVCLWVVLFVFFLFREMYVHVH